MVGAVVEATEIPIALPLGHDVAVEEDRFQATIARLAAEQGILSAGDEARVVGIGAVGRRDRAVVLLEPALHLGEQLALQQVGVGKLRIAVGVLGIEVAADLGCELLGVAHHLLPVVVAQPGVIIDELDPVPGCRARAAGRDRRLGERMSMGWAVHSTLHARGVGEGSPLRRARYWISQGAPPDAFRGTTGLIRLSAAGVVNHGDRQLERAVFAAPSGASLEVCKVRSSCTSGSYAAMYVTNV